MSESRFEYTGIQDEPYIPPALWDQAVKRSIQGKRGQALLQELREALLRLPRKRLIKGVLYDQGDCCVLGALALKRIQDGKLKGITSEEEFNEDILVSNWNDDEYQLIEFAVGSLGMTIALSWKISLMNDEIFENENPEQRWIAIMKWIDKNLKNENNLLGG
jgi:hypothetical protein